MVPSRDVLDSVSINEFRRLVSKELKVRRGAILFVGLCGQLPEELSEGFQITEAVLHLRAALTDPPLPSIEPQIDPLCKALTLW